MTGTYKYNITSCKEKYTSTRAGGDNFLREISTPFLIHNDGLAVWRHATYGQSSAKRFSLDYTSNENLKYPAKAVERIQKRLKKISKISQACNHSSFPMRKLQFDICEGTQKWKEGGEALWLFVVYCYADACLPVLNLETRGKFALQIALSRVTNVNLEDIYGRGVQMKLISLLYIYCHKLYNGKYLVPDKGNLSLHWPGIFDHPKGVFHAIKVTPRVHPRKMQEGNGKKKKKMKGYQGAKVFEPKHRGLHPEYIITDDYTSLYPSIMAAYCLCYTTFLTPWTIKKYNIKRHRYLKKVLGAADIISCGEPVYNPKVAYLDGYSTPELKETYFMQERENILGAIITDLMSLRSAAKKKLANASKTATAVKTYLEKRAKKHPNINKWKRDEDTEFLKSLPAPYNIEEKNYSDAMVVFKAILRQALNDEKNFDNRQLSLKLTLNSLYGFTTVEEAKAILALMEIGALVTAIGRCEIKRSACIAERLTTKLMLQFDKETCEFLEKNSEIAKQRLSLDDLVDKMYTKEEQKNNIVDFKHLIEKCDDNPNNDVDGDDKENEIDMDFSKKAKDTVDVGYGDTDSIMCSLPLDYIKTVKQAEVCSKFICNIINSYGVGIMNIDPEKIAKGSWFDKRKRYIMRLWNEYKKKWEWLWKGVEPKRRDTLPFANRLIEESAIAILTAIGDSTNQEDAKKAIINSIRNVKKELEKFATGRIGYEELILSKRLSKMKYKTEPEHIGVVKMRRARGLPVDVGSRIQYLFIEKPYEMDEIATATGRTRKFTGNKRKRKAIDMVEDPSYVLDHNLKINYAFTWDSKAKPPISRFFRHILAPVDNFPRIIDEKMTEEEKEIMKKRQEKLGKLQDKQVSKVLFHDIEQRFHKRRRLQYDQAQKKRHCGSTSVTGGGLLSYFKTQNTQEQTHSIIRECITCYKFFKGTKDICEKCHDQREDHTVKIRKSLKEDGEQQITLNDTCQLCVHLMEVPNIDPKACKLQTCEIYMKRARTQTRMDYSHKQLIALSQDW